VSVWRLAFGAWDEMKRWKCCSWAMVVPKGQKDLALGRESLDAEP